MRRWTAAEKAEVLRLRAAGLGWLRTAGYRWGVAKRPQYNPRSRRMAP